MEIKLIAVTLVGILTFIFMKINDLNKLTNGEFSFAKFIRIEWASICVSLTFTCGLLISKDEIFKLGVVSGFQYLAFFTIGLCSQYIAYKFNGAAKKKVREILSTPATEDRPE